MDSISVNGTSLVLEEGGATYRVLGAVEQTTCLVCGVRLSGLIDNRKIYSQTTIKAYLDAFYIETSPCTYMRICSVSGYCRDVFNLVPALFCDSEC